MDLSGAWLARPGEGDLHQRFLEPDFDDADWVKAAVPGHWRAVPELAGSDGPVLYRHRFDAGPPDGGRRRFLTLEGLFYYGDVWLDGGYLGATEGYFMPHSFEVTEATRSRTEHVLAVEVACPRQTDRGAKRLITGVFSHWDCLDAEWNPGGIWRPVRVEETGPVRIDALRVKCSEATAERGRLRLDLTLDAARELVPDATAARKHGGPLDVVVRARLTGPGVELEVTSDEQLADGCNRRELLVEVDDPPIWWPRRLGDQPLCDLEVTVEVGGEPSDTRRVTTAFREVRLHDWTFHVNGERMYVMGANHAPTRMDLAEATTEELERDVRLALEANLDMLRVHAHVTLPPFYDAADRAGLLLWQDFPLKWGYARSVRKQAARQATAMVDALAHHPSIVTWCAHNEPLAVEIPTGAPVTGKVAAKVGASMFAPTWNKSVLDRAIRHAIEKADGTRPVNSHSGVLPGPAHGGTDSHLYFGWYFGHMADLALALRMWPRLARFVSEFGAQAVPDDAEFMDPERFPDLDWERLLHRHCAQKLYFDEHVPPADYPDFDTWRIATQAYQAALLQLQIEDLRRVKHHPCGGFLQFCFADAFPSVTWSVLDHQRRSKPGFAAMRDACRPVLPMLDPRTGDVHVVSELRDRLHGAIVTVTAGDVVRRFSGDVDADSVTYIGSLGAPVDSDEASVALHHPALEGGEVINAYATVLLRRVRARPVRGIR